MLALHSATSLRLCCLWAFLCASYAASGAPPNHDSLPVSLNTLQANLLQSLSSLHSGEFSGTWIERFDSPADVDGAFSFSGKIRGKFDDAIKSYAVQRSMWTAGSGRAADGMYDYGLILLPGEIIRYGEVSRIITICNSDEDLGKSPLPSGSYFDPRSVGILWWGEIFRGAVINANHIERSLNGQPSSVTNESEGQKRYTWESTHMLKSFLVDLGNGQDSAHQRELSRMERYPDVDGNIWSPPLEVQSVSWGHSNGMLVPTVLHLETVKEVVGEIIPKTREERRFSKRSIDIHLEWNRVNDSFERTEFNPEWFHVKNGTIISDLRSPVKQVTYEFGSTPQEQKPRTNSAIAKPAIRSDFAMIVLVVNVVIVIVGICWYFFSRGK